jgi:hypothetical protein
MSGMYVNFEILCINCSVTLMFSDVDYGAINVPEMHDISVDTSKMDEKVTFHLRKYTT